MTVYNEKLGHNVGRPTVQQTQNQPAASNRRERRNMRKRTKAARETYLAAEEGFSAWRASLPAAGLGPLAAADAYAHYSAFEAARSHKPMALRAFGLRARAAFGASPNRKRRTVYLDVTSAAAKGEHEGGF